MERHEDRRTPIEVAIDRELERFVRLTSRLWLTISVLAALCSVLVALTISPSLGGVLTIACLAYLCFWVPIAVVESRAPLSRRLRTLADVVEATSPWSVLLILTLAEGAAYALASWIPPMLFMMLLFSHALQLRTWSPIVIGVVGGLSFPVLYFVSIHDRLPPELADHLVFETPMQLVRAGWLIVAGVVTAVLARLTRAAIVRAQRSVRAQELFGKYQLIKRVARGGMGEVFEALYRPEGGFERRVAVKRIHPHLAEEEKFVAYFRSEAEICSRLAHPNVVQVFDFGRVDGTYFLAMEYVDGMTLSTFLINAARRRTAVPEPVVGAIVRGLIAGLRHAHEGALGPDGSPLHVVHRDLCPHNILLSRNGEVKITDFGLARALKDAASTQTASVAGHLAYMAPEQVREGAFDERVDIFALGVITWELLAGRRLFARESQPATLEALMTEAVDSPREDLGPGWSRFLAKTLARDRRDRFRSVREALSVLEGIAAAHAHNDSRTLARLVEELSRESAPPPALGDDMHTVDDHSVVTALLDGWSTASSSSSRS